MTEDTHQKLAKATVVALALIVFWCSPEARFGVSLLLGLLAQAVLP